MLRAGYFAAIACVAALATSGCGRDPCLVDPLEDSGGVIDLGTFSDQETRMEFELTLHQETDKDVFSFDVVDQGNDGNPVIFLWVRGLDDQTLTATLNFQCTSDEMVFFGCEGVEVPSSSAGRGCQVSGNGELYMEIDYDCEGVGFDDTDNGFAVLTIEREVVTDQCAAYDLEIFTD